MKALCFILSAVALSAYWGAGNICAEPTRVDLEVEMIQMTPQDPTTATPVKVFASIRNNGSEEVQGIKVLVEIYHKGKVLKGYNDIPALSKLPRAASGLSLPISLGFLPAGQSEIVVVADPRNEISETNEGNNTRKLTISVRSVILGAPYSGNE